MIEFANRSIEAILFGFGTYTMLFLAVKPLLSESRKSFVDSFDNSACLFAAFVGLVYLIGGFAAWILQYSTAGTQIEIYMLNDRHFGKFWILYWIPIIFYVLSQLLWFRKIRNSKPLRLVIALFLMTVINSIIVYITSLNRDYMPSTWYVPIYARILDWLFSFGLFGLTTIIFHISRSKVKQVNSNR